MLMVCTNCKSKDIISIQDQLFCINCGQMVSQQSATKGKAKSVKAAKPLPSGLPAGVKIIEPHDNEADVIAVAATDTTPPPEVTPQSGAGSSATKPHILDLSQAVITNHHTSRTLADLNTTPVVPVDHADPPAAPKPRKRKPGRPKAGRLDVPKAITSTTQAAPTPDPKPKNESGVTRPAEATPAPAPEPSKRQFSDITHRPTKPRHQEPPAHHVHRVGVAPLHFGSVISFSLRAQAKRHHLILAMASALLAGIMATIGAWYLLTTSPAAVMQVLANHWLVAAVEAVALLKLYYIGRTIGHAAITYGVAREADHRPVSLTWQLSAAVNSFTRRLRLDSLYALTQIALLSAMTALLLTGGARWPVPAMIQILALYSAFLVLLYLMAAAAITRGLAGVAVILTNLSTAEAYKLGWQLFRHRLELVGIRLLSCIVELIVVLPLLAAGISLYLFLPAGLHAVAAIGIGLVTWLIGSLMGAGSASWWAGVYRKIIMLDQPAQQFELLASRLPGPARGRYLVILAAISGFLLASVLLIPLLMG